jgi:hypothetical protein
MFARVPSLYSKCREASRRSYPSCDLNEMALHAYVTFNFLDASCVINAKVLREYLTFNLIDAASWRLFVVTAIFQISPFSDRWSFFRRAGIFECMVDLCYLTFPWCAVCRSYAARGLFSFRRAKSPPFFFLHLSLLRGNFLSARRSTVPVEFQSTPIDHSSELCTS